MGQFGREQFLQLRLSLLFLLIPSICFAAAPDRPTGSVAIAGAIISSNAYNNDLNTIYTYLQNGVDTYSPNSITNGSIAMNAVIAYSKLNLSGSILNSDIATGASIDYAKLNLASAVKNSDLAGSIQDNRLSQITTAGKVSSTAFTVSGQTVGDILQYKSTGWDRFAATSSAFFLKSQGSTNPPVWAAVVIPHNTDYSFSAYAASDQTASFSSATQIVFDTEDFDTGNNFASNTFTAPVTGKYLFTISLDLATTTSTGTVQAYIYKNGSQFSTLGGTSLTTAANGIGGSIIMNLTASDTVSIYLLRTLGSNNTTVGSGATKSRFTGCYLT